MSVHAYGAANVPGTLAGQDNCPSAGNSFSGELGYAVGGAYFFSRTGSTTNSYGESNQGSGTTACYGSPADDHHRLDKIVSVLDDNYGGSIGFIVGRDYNRTSGNTGFTGLAPQAGPDNGDDSSHLACGDGIIEPCPLGTIDSNTTATGSDPAGGCNNLDAAYTKAPLPTTCPTCVPAPANLAPNTWTVPGGKTLGDFAGADGAVFVFVYAPATTGKAWTH